MKLPMKHHPAHSSAETSSHYFGVLAWMSGGLQGVWLRAAPALPLEFSRPGGQLFAAP